MKKLLTVVLALVLMLQTVFAVGVDLSTGINIEPETFTPRVFLDTNSRIVLDDPTESGPLDSPVLVERINNYAFEGESIIFDVMVWDKNGVPEKINDVYVKLAEYYGGSIEYPWNLPHNREVNCNYNPERTGLCLGKHERFDTQTESPICEQVWFEGEEALEWNAETMGWYTCHLTVETSASMHGQFLIGAVAEDLNGEIGVQIEQEVWYLNPEIVLGLDGSIDFGQVLPGGTYKSSTITLTNNAEPLSGVLLDMFIAGTDFYDPAHAGTMCPTSNVLLLNGPDGVKGTADDALRYYATQGAYDTRNNDAIDAENYDAINHYMDGAGAPVFNNFGRIIEGGLLLGGFYPAGNVLSPGADMSMNFKLKLPEPCNGGPFTQGKIMFFGEAI